MFSRTHYQPDKFDPQEYQKRLQDFIAEYESKAVLFADNKYAGHMNWDVSAPHVDVLKSTIAFNQNIVADESSPLATNLEKEFINMLAEDLGYPKTSWGYISSGGTVSNIAALWVARNKQKSRGLDPKYVLIAEDRHYSIEKGCEILGLQAKILHLENGKVVHFKDENIPYNQIAAVVCICGATEDGRVDDIIKWREFCDRGEHKIHLHVDAAYGGYYAYCKNSDYLLPEEKIFLNNLNLADSITIDPHKLGYAPYPAGVFLLKDVNDVMFINPIKDVKYLGVTSTSSYTIEGSRSGAIAAACYFAHKELRPYYGTILENNLIGAELLREKIRNSSKDFILYPTSGMGQVCFTCKTLPMNYLMKMFCGWHNVQNNKLQIVTTNIDGIDYFRICNMNPSLKDHIDSFWQQFYEQFEDAKLKFDQYVETTTKNILSIGERCETEKELRSLIQSGKRIVAYNGFEPSGRVHIAQAVMTVLNANLLMENGCDMIIYIGEHFAKLNHKLGCDMEKIKVAGEYLIHVLLSLGISKERLQFIKSSDLMFKDPNYWERVLDISARTKDSRAKTCSQIMGVDNSSLFVSNYLYPCMQVADVFEMDIDIAQLGSDQSLANDLAREYANLYPRLPKNGSTRNIKKPIALEHHVVIGLEGPGKGKMSKTNKISAVFVDDSDEVILKKVMNANCHEKETKDNPIFEYIKYIILPWCQRMKNQPIIIEGKEYNNINEIESNFEHFNKTKLKQTVAKYFNEILVPVRKHFLENQEARNSLAALKRFSSGPIQRMRSETPTLSVEKRKQILLSFTEESQGEEMLDELLSRSEPFIAYNGFEPSGRMHIAQAMMTALNTNAIIKAGGFMILYIADIFAKLNHKMGGDINKIRDVGQYFIEVFKACGMDLKHVKFIWATDFIRENCQQYFELVNDISEFATLSRISRTVQIMGRKEGDNLSLSQLIYPCMQATDVFLLNVDVCQLGVDQRKVNMLAIDYASETGRKKPIVLSHHMLMSLKGTSNKMSKSDPDGAIFIEDSRDDIIRKIGKAICPQDISENPLFEYIKHIIIRKISPIVLCGQTYFTIEEIQKDFIKLIENESQFRNDVANYIDQIIQPIRDHFQTPELQDLLRRVESYRVTR